MHKFTLAAAVAAALFPVPLMAQQGPAAPLGHQSAYQPYEFLIGDWYSKEGTAALRQSFAWGPSRSYIRYSTFSTPAGGQERLHFDGIMVWNPKTNMLDFVFAVEPGSGTQERGTVRAESNGVIVRDVELNSPGGEVSTFRQTIARRADGSAVTSLMRRTATGWEPNFPGSEEIIMERR